MDEEQHANISHGGDASEKGAHQHLQSREDGDQTKNAQDTREPKDGDEMRVQRKEADQDDDEIKDVPGVPEELPRFLSMSNDLQEYFYREEVQDGPVERSEQLSIPFHYRRVGFQSDDDAGPYNGGENEVLEAAGFYDPMCQRDHGNPYQ